MKYRKKPVIIEAIQYNKNSEAQIIKWGKINGERKIIPFDDNLLKNQELLIDTLEGTMHVSIGDYIIKGVNGEFYPCKPDIFKKTYEEVKENEVDQEDS